jgi:hypothetical protein
MSDLFSNIEDVFREVHGIYSVARRRMGIFGRNKRQMTGNGLRELCPIIEKHATCPPVFGRVSGKNYHKTATLP